MILEAVAAVTTACKALEMAAGAASNIEQLGSYIGKLGESEFDLQRAKNSKNLSEAEAMKIVMAEETLRQSRESIKSIFLQTNRMDLWTDMMQKMAEARKNRQAFIKAEASRKKKLKKQLTQYALIFMVVLVLVPATIGGLLAWLTNR
tara:strand:+ start:364 stop:807 length:444 start_codon:yes stop_codon:yes gene_type:complete